MHYDNLDNYNYFGRFLLWYMHVLKYIACKPEQVFCVDLLNLVGELEGLFAGEELHHLLRLHDVPLVEDHAARLEEGHRREVPE